MADRCRRAMVQLSMSWAPGCQSRVEGKGQEPQGAPRAPPQQRSRALSSPQKSCCLWACGAVGLPAGMARRYGLATGVVGEEQDPAARNTNGKAALIPCWHTLKWRDCGNGTFSYVQTHCACLCSFGKPFSSPFQQNFHLQYDKLAQLVLRY